MNKNYHPKVRIDILSFNSHSPTPLTTRIMSQPTRLESIKKQPGSERPKSPIIKYLYS